jgi:hypothetical protein
MRSRSVFSIALFVTLGLTLTSAVRTISAQERTEQNVIRYVQSDPKPTNCENHIAVLEAAHYDAGKDGLIILIARLGNGDNKRELNQHRLHSARAYLTEYLHARSPNTIVIAEGERVEGYGRIEVYVGGKLYSVLAIKANADLSVGSCEPAELDDARQRQLRKKLYPWLYQNQAPRRLREP